MTAPPWTERRPPELQALVLRGAISTPADLTALRRDLHEEVLRLGLPDGVGRDDVERLLLSFEELTSNGLRHGRDPVCVRVTQDAAGWLIDVTDAAPENRPAPAVGRDPAHGGMGLYLVARLSAAHGWWVSRGRKHVWAHVQAVS
jgi:anti-sigma regulatory factor (Ser/Thr protein kinase)